MNKIGIDTNLLIYTLEQTSPFHAKSFNLLNDINNNLFTTSKNISEYFAVCTKLGIKASIIEGFYKEIKNNFTILFLSNKSLATFETLFKKYNPKGNRIYDIEVASILISNNILKIATVNVDDFNNIDEVEIIPF